MLWHMYGALSIDKKIITQLDGKSQDETFEPK
jgi:hypothetical protein